MPGESNLTTSSVETSVDEPIKGEVDQTEINLGSIFRLMSIVWRYHRYELFIFIAAFTPFLGFITWSVHAHSNDLSLSLSINLLYVTVGLPPTMLLFALAAFMIGLIVLIFKLRALIGNGILFKFLSLMGYTFILVLGVACASPDTPRNFKTLFVFLLIIVVFVAIFVPLVMWKSLSKRVVVATIILVGAGLAMLSIYAYSRWVYPLIPQAYGGGDPRCARIFVERSQLPETIAEKLFKDMLRKPGDVISSDELNVLHSGENSLFVKTTASEQSNRETHEISRNWIRSIEWQCDQNST